MHLTRHAKNRVRFIARRVPKISETVVLAALDSATEVSLDSKGNRRVKVQIAGIMFLIVVDEVAEAVVTIWRED